MAPITGVAAQIPFLEFDFGLVNLQGESRFHNSDHLSRTLIKKRASQHLRPDDNNEDSYEH